MTVQTVLSLTDDLITISERLLADGLASAKQADIRRAISTAYYAVFHRLCELCADALVGKSHSPDAYTSIYRSLDHGSVLQTLKQAKARGDVAARIIDDFAELQDARHWADYDPRPRRDGDSLKTFPAEKATELVKQASAAIAALNGLDDATKLALAAQLVGKARGRTRQ